MEELNTAFTSEETQEVADPASEGAEDQNVAVSEPGEPPKKGNQDASIASAAAAARRQAQIEAQAQYKKWQQEQEQQYELQSRVAKRADTLARSRGFQSYEELETAAQNEDLKNGKLSPDVLNGIVQRMVQDNLANNPAIRQAAEYRQKAEVDAAFSEFQKQFPDEGIGSVADFLAMDNYDVFEAHVTRGLSFADAYWLANKQRLLLKQTAAGKQAAMNAIGSKAHMRSSAGGYEADEVTVPRDVYRSYRQMLPEWTDRQIRQHYAKSIKEG